MHIWASFCAAGLRHGIHRLGQFGIKISQAIGVMGGEPHLNPIVDIKPFRMMVELFGFYGGSGHPTESRVERAEAEGFFDRQAIVG